MTDDDHPDRRTHPGGGADHGTGSAGAPGHPGGPQEPVGSVGEEAAKLLGVLSQWAREQGPQHGEPGDADGAHGGHGPHDHAFGGPAEGEAPGTSGPAECRWCPVCRAVHVVRQTSPEVKLHLAQAASSLVQAAAGLLATHTAGHPGPSHQGGAVQKIDLDDETEWDEDR